MSNCFGAMDNREYEIEIAERKETNRVKPLITRLSAQGTFLTTLHRIQVQEMPGKQFHRDSTMMLYLQFFFCIAVLISILLYEYITSWTFISSFCHYE